MTTGTYFQARFAYYDTLPQALSQNLVSISHIDKALTRLYSSLVSVGYFDPLGNQTAASQYLRKLAWKDIKTTDDTLAYQMAVEGLVLVKNDGLLPLANKSIALVGPMADGE
jgi:xylan 1,4-beta-xylosidase